MLPGLMPNIAGLSVAPARRTYVSTAVSTADASTYTFTSQNIGGPGLIVVMAAVDPGNGTTSINSVTIGGSAATSAVSLSGDNKPIGLFYRRVTSGTTATIVVSPAGACNRCAISVYRITDNISDSPYHTASASGGSNRTLSVALNIPANGIAIAGFQEEATNSVTWAGITEDVDADYETIHYSSASQELMSAETGRTISSTVSTFVKMRLVAASWA